MTETSSKTRAKPGKEKDMPDDGSERYLGDMIFEELMKDPGFKKAARRLVERDWRTGSRTFQEYVEPLIEQLPFEATFPSWGDLSFSYLERRIMVGLDERSDPWLWAYHRLTGAFVSPETARSALNSIAGTAK